MIMLIFELFLVLVQARWVAFLSIDHNCIERHVMFALSAVEIYWAITKIPGDIDRVTHSFVVVLVLVVLDEFVIYVLGNRLPIANVILEYGFVFYSGHTWLGADGRDDFDLVKVVLFPEEGFVGALGGHKHGLPG